MNAIIPPERQAMMRLQDGRKLAWDEWGLDDGIPVLFCTGAGMSGWLGFGQNDLSNLGLRLLAIDRPGLGSSDPDPHKTLLSWADDIRQLIQAQHLHHVLTVGFSQGAPFAFALAEQGLVEAVAIVSGQDELAHPRLESLLHPDVAGMIAAIQQDALGFGQHFAQIATAEELWGLIMGMSAACDRTLYESEAFGVAYRRALQEGFAQGPEGYIRDLINTFGTWPFQLEKITSPVDLWYGALDTSTVHSPDFGATLSVRLPHASRIVEPQEGGSILWTQARAILGRLKSYLPTAA